MQHVKNRYLYTVCTEREGERQLYFDTVYIFTQCLSMHYLKCVHSCLNSLSELDNTEKKLLLDLPEKPYLFNVCLCSIVFVLLLVI